MNPAIHVSILIEKSRSIWQVRPMTIRTVALEADAFEKLEAAKWSPRESFSAVVRRAQFPLKPHLASDLLEDFKQRVGSPLSEETLERLAEIQANPARG